MSADKTATANNLPSGNDPELQPEPVQTGMDLDDPEQGSSEQQGDVPEQGTSQSEAEPEQGAAPNPLAHHQGEMEPQAPAQGAGNIEQLPPGGVLRQPPVLPAENAPHAGDQHEGEHVQVNLPLAGLQPAIPQPPPDIPAPPNTGGAVNIPWAIAQHLNTIPITATLRKHVEHDIDSGDEARAAPILAIGSNPQREEIHTLLIATTESLNRGSARREQALNNVGEYTEHIRNLEQQQNITASHLSVLNDQWIALHDRVQEIERKAAEEGASGAPILGSLDELAHMKQQMATIQANIKTQETTRQGILDAVSILQRRYNEQWSAHESVSNREIRRENRNRDLKNVLARVHRQELASSRGNNPRNSAAASSGSAAASAKNTRGGPRGRVITVPTDGNLWTMASPQSMDMPSRAVAITDPFEGQDVPRRAQGMHQRQENRPTDAEYELERNDPQDMIPSEDDVEEMRMVQECYDSLERTNAEFRFANPNTEVPPEMNHPAPFRLIATGFQAPEDGGEYSKNELEYALDEYPMFQGLIVEKSRYHPGKSQHGTPARLEITIKGMTKRIWKALNRRFIFPRRISMFLRMSQHREGDSLDGRMHGTALLSAMGRRFSAADFPRRVELELRRAHNVNVVLSPSTLTVNWAQTLGHTGRFDVAFESEADAVRLRSLSPWESPIVFECFTGTDGPRDVRASMAGQTVNELGQLWLDIPHISGRATENDVRRSLNHVEIYDVHSNDGQGNANGVPYVSFRLHNRRNNNRVATIGFDKEQDRAKACRRLYGQTDSSICRSTIQCHINHRVPENHCTNCYHPNYPGDTRHNVRACRVRVCPVCHESGEQMHSLADCSYVEEGQIVQHRGYTGQTGSGPPTESCATSSVASSAASSQGSLSQAQLRQHDRDTRPISPAHSERYTRTARRSTRSTRGSQSGRNAGNNRRNNNAGNRRGNNTGNRRDNNSGQGDGDGEDGQP